MAALQPLKAKSRKGLKYLREAFFIVYGREPKNNEEIFQAMFYHSFDKYVERFDGKLWVRTSDLRNHIRLTDRT
jgi:hypothetical protein